MPTIPVHLLVAGAGDRLLVRGQPSAASLPTLDLGLEDGETVVSALRRELARAWALDAHVLETHLQPMDGAGDEDLVALAVVDRPRSSWVPPGGLAWGPAPKGLLPPLRPRAETWIDEWTERAPVPAERPRWARTGWHDRALRWIDASLAEAGLRRDGPPDVRRAWTLAAVHRIPLADGGAAWFKAVFPAFHHEPAVTRTLHELRPHWIPEPIATEDREGWLLLAEVPTSEPGPAASDAVALVAIDRLAELGRAAESHADRLVALGCPRRPLDRLAGELDAALREAPALEGPEVDDDRRARVVAWVAEAAAWLAAAGIPDRLVHGDFTVFNVLGTSQGPVIIDWSDAAIAHPLLDISPLTDHPTATLDPARAYAAWLDALADDGDVDRLRDGLDRVLGLSAAYQVVSYAAILRGIEPANRYQVSDGFRGFWSLLDGHAG